MWLSVSLHLPHLPQPWEVNQPQPRYMASSLEIMLAGPIGAAAFNNEFGRPNLTGYFRTMQVEQQSISTHGMREYKPVMAGGVGRIRLS